MEIVVESCVIRGLPVLEGYTVYKIWVTEMKGVFVMKEDKFPENRRIKLNKELITKKDLFYWLVILLAGMILIFVWKVGEQDTLINQFSLAGSVSSILLALIAIAYAFFQTNDASNENKLMIQTLDKIREEVEQLGSVNESLINVRNEFFDFKKSTEDNNNKIINSIETIKDDINLDFIYRIIEEKYGEIDEDTKYKIEKSYNKEFENKLDKYKNEAFRINSSTQATMINYINSHVEVGEVINEKDLIEFVWKKTGIKMDSYECFLELEKLENQGFVSFVTKKDDIGNKIYTIKSADIMRVPEEEARILEKNYQMADKWQDKNRK